ncbi:MAG: hypothetical protein ABW173_01980 [Sphingomonas sp.]
MDVDHVVLDHLPAAVVELHDPPDAGRGEPGLHSVERATDPVDLFGDAGLPDADWREGCINRGQVKAFAEPAILQDHGWRLWPDGRGIDRDNDRSRTRAVRRQRRNICHKNFSEMQSTIAVDGKIADLEGWDAIETDSAPLTEVRTRKRRQLRIEIGYAGGDLVGGERLALMAFPPSRVFSDFGIPPDDRAWRRTLRPKRRLS